MKLPLSLIKSFIHLEMPAVKIGEALTLLGIELDRIENGQPSFAKVVIGEVLAVRKHPDAKNLQIAEVSDGEKTYTVVCGDPKCRAGMKTAFAKAGAVLTDADGVQRRIEESSIRGVQSFGMLCTGAELRISEDHEGILDLPHEMKTGEDAAHVLWDPVLELSLTPNLGHCMSALGVARELSAALQIPLTRPKAARKGGDLEKPVVVADFALCPRYMCCLIEGIKVGPSPFWLKKQMEACGQKSINNIVDIANYMMMKVGQPLHAFDYDLLEGGKIQVGPAKSAIQFPVGTLLISDGHKPIAIAGIMGGANSAVSEKTTRILLEAAYFDPIAIRVGSKKIGLRTESSQRFEKGIDPIGVEEALYEAIQLIGGIVKGSVDMKKEAFKPKEIRYRPSRINQILGTKLSETEIEEIFERLGFKAKEGKAEVPLYRADVNEEIDLVEEAARIYGYNNIEKTIPRCSTTLLPNDPMYLFENEMRRRLVSLGLTEFLSCDLISPRLAEISRRITPESMAFLKAGYSKSEEYSILRTSLLPGLLQAAKGNLSQKNNALSAFEIGRIHFLQEAKVVEIPMASILLTGRRSMPHWSQKGSDFDYFDLKGMIETLLKASFAPSDHIAFHPGRQADIHMGDLIVGSLGEVHPSLLEMFDIGQRILYAELNLSHLLKMKNIQTKVTPLPQFPASERDWTIPMPLKMPIEQVFQAIHSVKSLLLERVDLIDLYMPEGAEEKNATFRFLYRDPLKTISFEEVEAEHAKMMQIVRSRSPQNGQDSTGSLI
jgi:phenylalanyl-tRNA synthetase beta chain